MWLVSYGIPNGGVEHTDLDVHYSYAGCVPNTNTNTCTDYPANRWFVSI